MNRLTNLVWNKGATPLASFAYRLKRDGTRTNLSETVEGVARSYAWQYDTLDRLTNETVSGAAPTGTLGYGYDAVGNRTGRTGGLGSMGGQSFGYNSDDELTADTYDSDGNTATNGASVDSYDGLDRMWEAKTNGTSIYYGYDGDDERVVTYGAETIDYLMDDVNPSGYPQVLEEGTTVDSGLYGQLARVYNWGLNLISQEQTDPNNYGADMTNSYYGYDGHGNVRFLMDANGNITDTYTYDAFGSLVASSNNTPNVYLYSGQRFDPDLGLYYNRARYLSTDLGRFWTMDSYEGDNEDPLSLHKYLYAQDNPVMGTDPSGHDDLVELMTTMTISSGLNAIISPVVTKAAGYALVSLIPQPLILSLETLPLSAYEVGGSLNVQGFGGKIPAGLSASAGAEALWSPRTHNWAAYGYWGAGITFGNTTENASLQGNLGLVFGTPDSHHYTEWFETLSVPYNALPAPLTKRIDNLIASATLPGDVLQSLAKYGIPTPSGLNKLTVNVFKSPGGSSCGINFSYELLSREQNASSNVGYSWSYYVQLYPSGNVQF